MKAMNSLLHWRVEAPNRPNTSPTSVEDAGN